MLTREFLESFSVGVSIVDLPFWYLGLHTLAG